jgi:hypothetical protein
LYASLALSMPSLPCSSLLPSASSRRSASVSMRETKNDATDATFDGSPPPATSRSSPRMYASTTAA